MNRRRFLAAAAIALAAAPAWADGGGTYEVTRSDDEWRARLSDAEYRVLRQEATERAGTSPLDREKRDGLYHCKGCDLPVYSSKAKFDSGTGWPSFYESLPDAVRTKPDRMLLFVRTEVHCRRCGSHFGHIFDDGPPPTGKRHCLNGLSLRFEPGAV